MNIEKEMERLWKEVSKEPVEWYELRSLTDDEKEKSREFWDELDKDIIEGSAKEDPVGLMHLMRK